MHRKGTTDDASSDRSPRADRGGRWSYLIVPLLALCPWLASCGEQPAPSRPNVVLISLDTLRADRLSCYGNSHQTSPAIDQLAEQGVLFEHAISTSSWTLPAHISMLTGLPVSAHGVCTANPKAISSSHRGEFVSEDLSQMGYATAGFFTCLFLESNFGFGGGFDTWEHASSNTERARDLRRRWIEANQVDDQEELSRVKAEYKKPDFGAPEAEECVTRALAWLDEQREREPDRPFFLFVHLFDIHDPYRPPAPFDTVFDPDYQGDIRVGTILGPDATLRRKMDPREFEHIVALYDGEIAWVDSQVARVLEHLKQLGVEGNTVVALTSDHGEELLDHGRRGHHNTLYRECVHVPLIMRFPDVLPAGVRLRSTVSIIDIVPTLLALVGAPAENRLPGRDLSQLLQGQNEDPERIVVSELLINNRASPRWMVSLYQGDEHFIIEQVGTPEASARRYNLNINPLERGVGEAILWDSEEGRELGHELSQVRANARALRVGLGRRTAASASSLHDQDLEQLNALGYSGVGVEPDNIEATHLCMDGCVWRADAPESKPKKSPALVK
ncbi:MAG: arylsulfatase A-like enzyme [Planctomycetota bacterium]|jgi:arylsulfatase A-like enzyme